MILEDFARIFRRNARWEETYVLDYPAIGLLGVVCCDSRAIDGYKAGIHSHPNGYVAILMDLVDQVQYNPSLTVS